MRQAYIFCYSSDVGTRDTVTDVIDKLPSVLNWRYELPNTFLLVSEKSADDLAKEIRRHLGKGRFIVVELGPNRQGWLLPSAWKLIKDKHDPE